MSTSASHAAPPRRPPPRASARAIARGLDRAFAVYHLALAVFMAAAPHAFYKAIGPFGAFNAHYVRDVATFSARSASAWRSRSRAPPGACRCSRVTTVQFALHSVNHLLDIGDAHPALDGLLRLLLARRHTVLLAGCGGSRARRPAPTEGAPHEPHAREPPQSRRGPLVRVALPTRPAQADG